MIFQFFKCLSLYLTFNCTVLRLVLKDAEIQWFLKCVPQKPKPSRDLRSWPWFGTEGQKWRTAWPLGLSVPTLVRESLLSLNLFIVSMQDCCRIVPLGRRCYSLNEWMNFIIRCHSFNKKIFWASSMFQILYQVWNLQSQVSHLSAIEGFRCFKELQDSVIGERRRQ